MSSPTSGPYKSRLFNFFNRQSLQIKERLEQTGRHLKVAVEWGVQILIYPVYLLVQTGRMAGRKLGKTVERANLPPSPSHTETQAQHFTPDQPIERVLQAVEPWLSPRLEQESERDRAPQLAELIVGIEQHLDKLLQETASPETPTNSAIQSSSESQPQTTQSNKGHLTIQGVASQIETRELVLVSSDNQIFALLSPEQQKHLQKRIYWEVANYWYERRLQQEQARQFPELVPAFQQNSPNVLPPVRIFWKVIRWVQTSQVAIAVNLFGESTLVRSPAFPPSELIPQGDHPLAQIQAKLSDRLPGLGQRLRNRLDSSRNSQRLPDSSEADPFQIQAIIQAALDHFFGQHPERSHLQGAKTSKETSVLPISQSPTQQLPAAIEEPWLSWEDLYPETEKTATRKQDSKLVLPVPTQPVAPVKSKKSSSVTRPSSRRQALRKAVQPQSQSDGAIEQPASIVRNRPTDSPLEADPDWIETNATPIGYVKHPLVKILEWLDRLILRLEELLARIGNWLRQRF
jgi:hypothetical protein